MKKLLHSSFLLFFCCIITKSFGQATLIADGNIITSNISPLITNSNPSVSNPVASFSLVQSGSNANLTQVTFTTSGTYIPSTGIVSFALYVNNTGVNSLIGSTAVPSATVTATAAGLQTINLSTPYPLSTGVLEYYFFIVPTFGSSPVSGNTIAVSSISSANITVDAGSVSGSAVATGTLTILNPIITSTTPASRCGTGTVVLSAAASTGASINWFNVSSGGSSLSTGTSFTTPSISATTPYYAEASQSATIQAGTLSDNVTNLGGGYEYDQRTDLHWFSTTNAVVINSVDIYPSSAGTVIITMSNNSGTILQTSATVTISSGQISNTVPVTIPLGFSVPAGATNYELGGDATFSGAEVLLYRGVGTTYGPYPTNINGLSQTGDALVGQAFTGYGGRCYFYNWNVSLAITASPRSSDAATVNPVPTPTFTTSPGANTCVNSSVTYTTQAGQSAYTWNVPGILSTDYTITSGGTGSGNNTVTLTWLTPGSKTVTVNYSSGGCAGASPVANTTTVNALPVPSFTASPGINTCANNSVTYTTQAGQSAYTWSVPGVLSTDYTIASGGTGSGSNTATLTWLTPGSKTVTVNYSSNGCAGASPVANTTTVNALPVASFTASPGANTCVNSSVTYTTQAGQSAYTWNVPGVLSTDYTITSGGTGSGNNTVTLTWLTPGSKTVTVNYSSGGCAGASPVANTTTVNALPVPSFTASPGINTCANSSVTYTTQAGQSAYTWSVPGVLSTDYTIASGGTGSGSNTATLTWLTPGSKTVTVNYSSNGCAGASPVANTTTVNALPVASFTASPGANICVNSSATYATQSGASSYTWNVPGTSGVDYTITSGGTGSNMITLTWLTPGSKNVTVNYTDANGCTGASPASNTITVNALPVPTFTASPGANTCANSSVTYTTQTGELSYTWNVPGALATDYTITSGGTASNSVTLTWITPGSKTVTINYADIHGCTAVSPAANTTTVNALPVPSFTASPGANTCANSSVTYTTQSGQPSYTWSVPGVLNTDYTIASGGTGAGSNTVTITWLTPGSKTVTVNYTDMNGCTGLSPAGNTILINPLPAVISGPGQVCLTAAITLTDDSTGGGWTSGNSSAAVNPISGMVTGVSADTATITYTLLTGCTTSAVITVNPLPFAISGSNSVCTGSATTLSDAGGGTWSTNNSSLATINTGSGIVTGVSPGSSIIIYTLPTGCITMTTINVDSLPSPITGITNVCTGATTNLGNAGVGGTWSVSNVFYASVDESSGLVTGANAGTPTITYTSPAGCTATANITVNPLPAAINGSSSVCVGLTTPLSDIAGGGTWASSNTSLATVDVSSGSVGGVLPGSPVITYTLPTGCFMTKTVVVNPLPLAIGGTPNVCKGATTALADAGSGTWSSSNTAYATVNITSGMLTGLNAGAVTITYSLGTGCIATTPVTVFPVAPITGAGHVCAGATTTLSNSITGGTWNSSDGTLATVNMSSGLVTGIAAGSPTIIYTSLTGCPSTVAITVNAIPADYSITGGGNICTGGAGVPVELSGSASGFSYQLFNDTAPLASLAGTGVPLSFGLHSAAGIYTIVATNTATGCSDTMPGTAPIVVNAIPAVFTVTGGGNFCAGAGGLHVGLSGSNTGVNYQLYHGITHVGAPVPGTGISLDFGALTTDEVYIVIATIDSTSCSDNMAGNATIVTNVLPAVYPMTGGGSYCAGGTGVAVEVNSSDAGINYQLYKDGVATGPLFAGGSGAIDFGLKTIAGTYTAKAINATTGCVNDMSGAVAVTVTPVVTPSVNISTGVGDSLCSGSFTTITAISANGGASPVYHWTVNGTFHIGIANTLSYMPADGDIVAVTLNSSAACATPLTATAALDLTVFTRGTPAATVSADPGSAVCASTLVHFTNTNVFAGVPAFTWYVNGTGMGSDPFYAYTPVNGDDVYVQMVSNYFCRNTDTAASNHIIMNVQSPVPPTVTISAFPDTVITAGQTVTLTASVTNGGPAPAFQWSVNGTPVPGANSNAYSSSHFTNGTTITCQVVSSGVCAGLPGHKSVSIHISDAGVTQISSTGSNMQLAPNPNKGTFTIKGTLGTTNDAALSLVVTDMLGEVVYRNTVTAQNGILNEQVLLNSNLANGMYLLNVRSGDESAVFHFVMEK